jgi:hypothetical protein
MSETDEYELTKEMLELKDFRDKISEEEDLILFDEVLECVKAEAYRSAYIMNWICIAESIRNKLEKMKVRDPNIKDICNNLKNSAETGHSIDLPLITYAKSLGIIDEDEFKRLDLIRNMRNSYAHPSGNAPGKREVSCAITTGVKIVLSKPPLLRKGYVRQYLNKIFTDKNYMMDSQPIILEQAKTFILRVNPDSLSYAFEISLKKFDECIGDYDLKIFETRAFIFSHELLKKIITELNDEDIHNLIDEHDVASSLLFGNYEFWPELNFDIKHRVYECIVDSIDNPNFVLYNNKLLKVIFNLYELKYLSEKQNTRFIGIIEELDYSPLVYSPITFNYYSERILQDLESHNWDRQNYACETLRKVNMDEIESLDENILEQLGRNILQSAVGGSWKAKDFLGEVKFEYWPLKFVEGILLETMVNDDDKFRFKGNSLRTVLLKVIKHPQHAEIFKRLFDEIKISKPKYDALENYEKTLKKLDALETIFQKTSELEILGYLNELKDIIEKRKNDFQETP